MNIQYSCMKSPMNTHDFIDTLDLTVEYIHARLENIHDFIGYPHDIVEISMNVT